MLIANVGKKDRNQRYRMILILESFFAQSLPWTMDI